MLDLRKGRIRIATSPEQSRDTIQTPSPFIKKTPMTVCEKEFYERTPRLLREMTDALKSVAAALNRLDERLASLAPDTAPATSNSHPKK